MLTWYVDGDNKKTLESNELNWSFCPNDEAENEDSLQKNSSQNNDNSLISDAH